MIPALVVVERNLRNVVVNNMEHNKLIRDKIPEYIKSRGGDPTIHVADDKEYWQKLKEKLQEEVNEFNESETIEEMADIQEVIEAICDYKKFGKKEVKKVKKAKAKERGKFKKKIILEKS